MTSYTSSGALAPATAAQLAVARPDIKTLIVANNGVNPICIKFGSAPLSATDGTCLDGASSAGGEGGSLVLTYGGNIQENQPPLGDSVYGYSTAGTTFHVVQVDGLSHVIPDAHRLGAM
jgi:hypothetical protein